MVYCWSVIYWCVIYWMVPENSDLSGAIYDGTVPWITGIGNLLRAIQTGNVRPLGKLEGQCRDELG